MKKSSISMALVGLIFGSVTYAAEPDAPKEKQQLAQKLLNEALHSELYGDQDRRDSLLSKAQKMAPDFAPVRWQQGMVNVDGQWKKIADAGKELSNDPKIKKYLTLRAKSKDLVQDHMRLADWCRKNELQDQERCHLNRILEDEPNNGIARRRLGQTIVNGRWITKEEMEDDLKQVFQDRENLNKWRARLNRVRLQLSDRDVAIRKAGELDLASIDDKSAIMPMEQILSSVNQEYSLLVVDAVSKMTGQEAALSLARHSVFSNFPKVREIASVKLRDFEQLHYVPALLAELRTPIVGERIVTSTQDGRLVYRHVFYSETQGEKQVVVRETVYRRVALPGGNRAESLQRAMADLSSSMNNNNMERQMRNASTEQRNRAITTTLAVATSQQFGAEPRKWWNWWSKENEIYVSKNIVLDDQIRSVNIVDQTRRRSQGGMGSLGGRSAPISQSRECLIAGTPVMTYKGLMPIEKISVGDLVLSKDPETGELAFKPVLRTTIREPSKVVALTAGSENIRCSAGHPFWVSGNGWVLARDLKAGQSLHTANGAVNISSTNEGSKERTYNLVVEDFHTYFVGESLIYSHDFTMRESTDCEIPGLAK